MTKILTSPVTRQAIVKTVLNLSKLGLFAAVTVMASKTFKEAGDQFLSEVIQNYRQIKNIA